MDSIRWREWLSPRDQAHISNLGEWWIHRYGIPEFLGTDPLPDVLETVVVNTATMAFAAALQSALKKLRRGEGIPFYDIHTAMDRLQRSFLEDVWLRLGKHRGMASPLANWRELRPEITAISAKSRWQKAIRARLQKIALLSGPPPSGPGLGAFASPRAESGGGLADALKGKPVAHLTPETEKTYSMRFYWPNSARTGTEAETDAARMLLPEQSKELRDDFAAESIVPAPTPAPAREPESTPAWATECAAADPLAEASPPPHPSDVRGAAPSAPRRRGPLTDYKTAKRVAAITDRFGPLWSSGKALDKVLAALEKKKIPIPKTWPKREPPVMDWMEAGLPETRDLARKVIQHHRKLAAQARK